MTESSGEGASIRENREFPPPLSSDIQPSRSELAPFIPKRELYLKPDLPSHGLLHGEETMVWTAVILNQTYHDIMIRKGKEAADEFMAKIDKTALLYGAAYHDCGRELDFGYHKSEMSEHGPRGAGIFRRKWQEVHPELTEEQVSEVASIISNHTPLLLESIKRMAEKKKGMTPEDYDPQKLKLRLLQEADTLALVRTWYSHPSYGVFDPAVAKIRDWKVQKGTSPRVARKLLFPENREFVPLAHAHSWMDRLDPRIQKVFPGPDRSGVALEAGQWLGILKP